MKPLHTLYGGSFDEIQIHCPSLFAIAATVATDPAQKTQLQAIREQTRSAIDQVLTPAQEVKLKQALSQGKPLQEAVALSKITDAQKAQIRQVLLNAQVQAVSSPNSSVPSFLTPFCDVSILRH